jgi:hypothetical protein
MYWRRFVLAALALMALANAQEQQFIHEPEAIGELFASEAAGQGSLLLVGSGMRVVTGSSVTAGDVTALLRLSRGGEVRICPGTTLTVTTAPQGGSLMLSMATGTIETQYPLSTIADQIMTPDFRIQLNGPGDFHFAISADTRGDTCVSALEQNSASVIVSELMGANSYQVKHSEQVVFRGGTVTQADSDVGIACGCSAPRVPVLRAKVDTSNSVPKDVPALPALDTEIRALPPSGPLHVQVDVPFVFRAEEEIPQVEIQTAYLHLQRDAAELLIAAANASVMAPPPQSVVRPKKKRRNLFRRLGAFFQAIFVGGS